MWIYGDPKQRECAEDLCDALAGRLRSMERQEPGLERHSALVDLLLTAGELVQGLLDGDLATRGCDAPSTCRRTCETLLLDLATLVVSSWRGGFTGPLMVPRRVAAALADLRAPLMVDTKAAEGYAFYGVYPESYAEAARASGLATTTKVIGIRSIGATLSAVVAAALGSRAPITLRPVGHPFDRHVTVSPGFSKQLLGSSQTDFAIVDEGPGLSGSSFGCVADWLQENGVDGARIHFFPSHKGGPGAEASDRCRTRWAQTSRHVRDLDNLLLTPSGSSCRLVTWVGKLTGPLERPLEDISAGVWRRRLAASPSNWPPVDQRFERRKFLAHTKNGCWLIKFAGLGQAGKRKLAKGRLLAEKGFIPPVAGLCHGFLVQRWVEARSLAQAEFHREPFLEHLGRYLAFRSRSLPPVRSHGARPSQLCEMALTNTLEAMGTSAAAVLKSRIGDPVQYDHMAEPVDTDGRLHRWEWFADGRGSYWKGDALDHSAGHDLVGCQDLAWDVAGATIEFDLTDAEVFSLKDFVSRAGGRTVDQPLQVIFELCYAAFQLGIWSSARSIAKGEEIPRLDAAVSRYREHLRDRVLR